MERLQVSSVDDISLMTGWLFSTDMNNDYYQQNSDTSPVFKSILSTAKELISKRTIKNFKVLIYNGDADMACEYLGDQWFVYRLANDGLIIPGVFLFFPSFSITLIPPNNSPSSQ